jgi:hypothetical protein
MLWYLVALSMPINIDAQKHPLSAIFAFAAACLFVWFAVGRAKHRDERRARARNLSQWSQYRSPKPPRY